jgi:hypothetical protein
MAARDMRHFKKTTIVNVILNLILAGLLIGALATSWYRYEQKTFYSTTTIVAGANWKLGASITRDWKMINYITNTKTYDNTTILTQVKTSNDVVVPWQDPGYENQANIVWVILSFAVVGTVAAFLSAFLGIAYLASASARNSVLFYCGPTTIRIILVTLAIVAFLGTLTPIITLPGISRAYNDDTATGASCSVGPCLGLFQDLRAVRQTTTSGSTTGLPDKDCARTSGGAQVSTNTATATCTGAEKIEESWGPYNAWWITIVAFPVAVFALVVQATNRLPIPVDSVGVGEAM